MQKTKIIPKFKNWVKKNLYLSVSEIAYASIFIALWIVSRRFLSINLGIMNIGITYVWMILISLTTRPILGIFVLVIGDNLSLLAVGQIASWMWIYNLIPIIIYVICYFFKKFIFYNKTKWWWVMIVFSFVLITFSTFFVSYFNQGFIRRSKFNSEIDIDFSSFVSQITIWSVFSLMLIFQIVLLVVFILKRNTKIKMLLSIYSLVSLIIVITIWIIGPIANIMYLNRFGRNKDSINYWDSYNIFLIARILKTIVILPIYTMIVFPVYQASREISKHTHFIKW